MIIKLFNGRVVCGDTVYTDKSVYSENGMIIDVTSNERRYDEKIDLNGDYLSPGFIDIHVHGGADFDFMDGNESAVINACNFHFEHGTTTILPTTLAASYEQTMKALESIKSVIESREILPNIGGVHLEGPYFSQNQCGAQNKTYITAPKKEDYLRILENYSSIIKRWSFAPELEGSAEFIEALKKYDVLPSLGHTNAKYDDVIKAFENGCNCLTHFYSCMSTVTREKGFRKLGVIECGYLFDDLYVEVIADGCHIPSNLFELIYKIKGSSRICLVTDAMRCAGSEKKESHIGGVPCIIENGVAFLTDKSAFAGSIATTDRLVRFCVKDVGIRIEEAVKMVSEVPAKYLGLNKGIIEKNKDAAFVV